jgi:hypothetical protein
LEPEYSRLVDELVSTLKSPQGPAGDALAWRGIRLTEVPSVRTRLERLVRLEAPLAYLGYRSAQALYQRAQPAALVAAHPLSYELRSLFTAAQEAGVPVAYLPHARHLDNPRFGALDVDLVLADGEPFARDLARRGHPEETIHVVGTPKYDRFVRMVCETSPEEAKCALGLDPDRAYICLATLPDLEQSVRAFAACAQFCRSRPGFAAVAKCHPRLFTPTWREQLLAAGAEEAHVLADCDPLLVFHASEVVICGRSTTGLEALIAQTPLVYFGPADEDTYGYERSGAALVARDPEELGECLRRLVDDPRLRAELGARGTEHVQKQFGPLDGRATERATQLVRELVVRFTSSRNR